MLAASLNVSSDAKNLDSTPNSTRNLAQNTLCHQIDSQQQGTLHFLESNLTMTPKYKPTMDLVPHSNKMRTSSDFFKPNGPASMREFALRRRENVACGGGYQPNYLTPTTSFNLKGYRISPTKQIIRPDGLVSPSFQNSR